MAVYQVSIHDTNDEIIVLITEAENRHEALAKAMGALRDHVNYFLDVASVYVLIIPDAVLL